MSAATALSSSGLDVRSHCPYCVLRCGMLFAAESADAAASVAGDAHFPVNNGDLCIKGWTATDLLRHPQRLTTPSVRSRGELRSASWGAALDLVADAIRPTREANGPDAVGMFGSGALSDEKAYLLGKFARDAVGTANIDHNGWYCMAAGASAGHRAIGGDRGLPIPLADIAGAEVVLIVGGNPADTLPPIMQWFDRQRRAGGRLIVADPRRTTTARVADLHLPITPGADLALANGLLDLAIEEKVVAPADIEARTVGFDATFYFTTGRSREHCNSGSPTRMVVALVQACPRPPLQIHPIAARRHRITSGSLVTLGGRCARAEFAAEVTADIRPDTLFFFPFHWGGAEAANRLTSPALDPTSRMPEFKLAAVPDRRRRPRTARPRGVPVSKPRLAIVGNGMAAGRLLDDLLARNGADRFAIEVFGEEPHGPYNRILIGRIIFGTGSRAVIAPLDGLRGADGRPKGGIIAYRTVDDGRTIRGLVRARGPAVVLGGGLLGLEAARSLADLGRDVTVAQRPETLMDQQVDDLGGQFLRRSVERLGIRVALGARVTGVRGDEHVTAVTFDDGRDLPADLLVLACGIRPRVDAAAASGPAINRGIVVDDRLATSAPGVSAVGECAEHDGQLYGIVEPIWDQCKVLADVLADTDRRARYRGSRPYNRRKWAGVAVASMGQSRPADDGDKVVQIIEERAGTYRKLIVRDDRLVGDIAASPDLVRGLDRGDPLPTSRLDILCSAGAFAVTSDPEICNCHHVTESALVTAIDAGRANLAELATATRAGDRLRVVPRPARPPPRLARQTGRHPLTETAPSRPAPPRPRPPSWQTPSPPPSPTARLTPPTPGRASSGCRSGPSRPCSASG